MFFLSVNMSGLNHGHGKGSRNSGKWCQLESNWWHISFNIRSNSIMRSLAHYPIRTLGFHRRLKHAGRFLLPAHFSNLDSSFFSSFSSKVFVLKVAFDQQPFNNSNTCGHRVNASCQPSNFANIIFIGFTTLTCRVKNRMGRILQFKIEVKEMMQRWFQMKPGQSKMKTSWSQLSVGTAKCIAALGHCTSSIGRQPKPWRM